MKVIAGPTTFTHVLVGDVIDAQSRLQSSDSPTSRRDLVRAAFAAIEGLYWRLKQDVLEHAVTFSQLSIHERAALADESYAVSDRGVVSAQARFLPLATGVRLVIEIVRRYRSSYAVDLNHPGWQRLKRAVEIRNRLTHPKTLDDLSVSDEELSDVMGGFSWVLALVIEVLRETNEHARERRELERLKAGHWAIPQ